MSMGISARLKYPKKHEVAKSHSQSQILANKLRQDGVMGAVENVMQAVEQVVAVLASSNMDPNISYKDSIINLCQHLKVYGAYLEILYQDQLNRAFVVFRNSSQDDIRLDYLSRLHLLELIELRAKGWKGTDVMNQYYRKKIEASESTSSMTESLTSMSISTTSSPPLLGPGEVIKPSGKFNKPTRIPGKNYCKDEVVIRNADSGKVTPGAKERLVQITGANEESINTAKHLIEDTIRRNASPIRDGMSVSGPLTGSSSSINSSASDEGILGHNTRLSRALMHSLSTNDANIGEYKYTVFTNGHTIKITGDNLDLVRTSKLVLDEYFSGEPLQDIGQFYSFDTLPQPILPGMSPHSRSPSSPPEAEQTSVILANGQNEDTSQVPQLRRPHFPVEELIRDKSVILEKPKVYSIEFLARLAMSPVCLQPPTEWDRVKNEYPGIVRNEVEHFDAKQYLTRRADGDYSTVVSAGEETPLESGEV